MNKHLISLVFVIIFSVVLTSEVNAAKFFRFKNTEGKMVVSSTLPPEVSQKGYDIVTEMGVVLETVAPRKTEQQLKEEIRNKAKKEEEDRRFREQQQLDSILINSYTDISDIERARDSELTAKDRDIMLYKQNVNRLTRLLEDTQTRAARDERLGRAVSQKILTEVEGYKERIKDELNEVKSVEKKKSHISERYSSSIIRFSELKAAEQLRRHRPGELPTDNSKAVIFSCDSEEICDAVWQASLLYANENSTTELAWANELTIMMRKPKKDDDISIMVTRVKNKNGQGSSLVMEVRCSKTQVGENNCQSEVVRSIEDGFIPFIK